MIPLKTDLLCVLSDQQFFALSAHLIENLCNARKRYSLRFIFGDRPLSAQTLAPYRQSTLPIEERIHDLVSRMTLEEKARQLDMYAGVTATRR